jgi:chromosome segregation ATPase
MQAIIKNTRFTEAQNTLAELSAAFNAATAEESRLLGLLAAPAAASFDPLAAGLRLLRGEPAQRNDSTGLNRELAQVRERLDTLRPAVEAQRAAVAALSAELSAAVCAEAQPTHTKAAQGVVDALEGLRAALAAEAAVRGSIEAAGYRCSLEAVAEPELSFADTQSAASRLLRDVTRRLEVERLRTGGQVHDRRGTQRQCRTTRRQASDTCKLDKSTHSVRSRCATKCIAT